MSISLAQGIWISVFAIIAGIDFWLEGFYIFRPIIVCTVVGAILGDLKLGLVAGGLTELVFAGLTPVGGTQPPNPVMAGIMTVVLAYTTGHSPATAIGLSLPFSILTQYIILFYYSAFSVFAKKFDEYAEKLELNKFRNLAYGLTLLVGLTYGVLSFLCVYAAQKPMSEFVNSFPGWLSHGFTIAGGMLPAVGFAILLQTMLKGRYVPYLLLGFTAACFIKFGNLMPVAVIGGCLAAIEYYQAIRNRKIKNELKEIRENQADGGDSDGI